MTPDVRRELSRIEDTVPGADAFTRRVAEVIFLIREINYIPRTIDNIARLLVEKTTDDVQALTNRIKPELDKLIKAKLVARMGEEYEFLTGERRTFEEEVSEEAANIKWQDLQSGLAKEFATPEVLGFETIPLKGSEFQARMLLDGTVVTKNGFVDIRIHSPLDVLAGTKISDIEDQSLRPDEQQTLFVLCDRIPGFDEELKRYLAMRAVIDRWKGDPHKSQDALRLATDRESHDLEKLRRKVLESIRDGIKNAHVVFRGGSRTVSPKSGQTPGEALRGELATFWPTLYPKYEKVPVRITNEARGILDVLKGAKDLTSDVKELKLFDKAGQVDPHCPLLDHIRMHLPPVRARKNARSARVCSRSLRNRLTVGIPGPFESALPLSCVPGLSRSSSIKSRTPTRLTAICRTPFARVSSSTKPNWFWRRLSLIPMCSQKSARFSSV